MQKNIEKIKINSQQQYSHSVFIKMCNYIKMLPKFLRLLMSLLKDPRVSTTDKAILGATIAYLLDPVDLVPDWIPFIGLVDDVYLVALALLRLVLRTNEQVLRDHWTGQEDIIPFLKKAANLAMVFLPVRVRQAILAKVDVK
ncbi:MAG: DUF1232 domain-containing protein [Nitrospiraceae bacterium]|nr:DUF1232 domain-containing protein [Nitrospiraceae bacterium]